jgi:hypothetical protein
MDIDKVSRWYNKNVDLEENRLRLGRLKYEVILHYIRNTIFSL